MCDDIPTLACLLRPNVKEFLALLDSICIKAKHTSCKRVCSYTCADQLCSDRYSRQVLRMLDRTNAACLHCGLMSPAHCIQLYCCPFTPASSNIYIFFYISSSIYLIPKRSCSGLATPVYARHAGPQIKQRMPICLSRWCRRQQHVA